MGDLSDAASGTVEAAVVAPVVAHAVAAPSRVSAATVRAEAEHLHGVLDEAVLRQTGIGRRIEADTDLVERDGVELDHRGTRITHRTLDLQADPVAHDDVAEQTRPAHVKKEHAEAGGW